GLCQQQLAFGIRQILLELRFGEVLGNERINVVLLSTRRAGQREGSRRNLVKRRGIRRPCNPHPHAHPLPLPAAPKTKENRVRKCNYAAPGADAANSPSFCTRCAATRSSLQRDLRCNAIFAATRKGPAEASPFA